MKKTFKDLPMLEPLLNKRLLFMHAQRVKIVEKQLDAVGKNALHELLEIERELSLREGA